MDISHSIRVATPKDQVFKLYADVASWPAWDSELVDAYLPAFVQGASGWLKPRQGPKAKIKLVAIEQDASFIVESALPLCRVRFGHALTEEDGQTRVTHWVSFSGALAPLFRRLIGRGIAHGLPDTLAGLKHACEAKAQVA